MHASLVWINWATAFKFYTRINQCLKLCLVKVLSRSVENCRFWGLWKNANISYSVEMWVIILLWGLRCEDECQIKQCDNNIVRITLWERRCKNVRNTFLIVREKDVVGKTLWVSRCEKDVVRRTLWKRRCEIDGIRKTVWERCWEKDIAGKTLWERRYEKDVMRKTLWERRCEKNGVKKALWERYSFWPASFNRQLLVIIFFFA